MAPTLRRAELVAALTAVAAIAGAGISTIAAHPHRDTRPYLSIPLTDQDGATRALSEWHGRVLVLDFMYTSCGDICPLKTTQLVRVQAALPPNVRSRVQFVSISVDPLHDDPAALRAYAARASIDLADWSLLTGGLEDVAAVVAAFDAHVGSEINPLEHVGLVWTLDPQGHVVHRYDAEPLDETALERDLAAPPPLTPRAVASGL